MSFWNVPSFVVLWSAAHSGGAGAKLDGAEPHCGRPPSRGRRSRTNEPKRKSESVVSQSCLVVARVRRMPSAAKLVKQASTEAPDPLRQGVTIIEHKIRNLEKRKVKLESYRALQNEGKDLQPEQLAAVAKYDEVIQTLEFARDLCKQFNSISADNAKAAKRQARKEALERQANDLARIKDVLLFQNVLNQIGTDAVREDFLNGTNGATKLTETDLQLFDTFYETVTPKSYDDAKISV
ncbi:hypothetical protein FOCC_FOCC017656, partial [Frankliniella occidentalis]